MRNFAKILREARDQAGLTQQELASQVGIDPSYISKLERGGDPPARDKVFAIADALGITNRRERAYFLLAAGYAVPEELDALASEDQQEQRRIARLPLGAGSFNFPKPAQLEEEILIEQLRRLVQSPQLSQNQRTEYVDLLRSFLSWLELLQKAQVPYKKFAESIDLIRSFLSWMKFRVHEE